MLLDEALKSKSVLSYILKLITLFVFYKFFLSKSAFVAVTEEEKKSVLENTKHYQDNWKKYSNSIF